MSQDTLERLQAALPERYTIVRFLARGGAATVYQAREHHPKRDVAIKVLHPDLAARLGRERFLREVDLGSNLTHPHIVPIFAAGEAGGLLYYVMPYVSGESLEQRLQREGKLPVNDAVRISVDVAEALEYAHQRNVVHRDIKPGNILLHEGHALVADFGIARAISASETERPITEIGLTLGTPAYMSPEQATADPRIDGRADVYALACVLYEMLSGAPPFDGESSRVVLTRQVLDPMPPLGEVLDPAGLEVEEVLQRALAKAPEDRFATAGAFADALMTARGYAPGARSASAPKLEPATPRRRVHLMVGAAGVAVAAIVALRLVLTGPESPIPAATGPYVESVAVMPFDNLTGDSSYDHVSTGIADEVITHLARVAPLKVISRHSVEALKGKGLTASQLAETLGVSHILEGALRVDEESIRVTVQHVDKSDVLLGAKTYGASFGSLVRAQETIAQQVSEDFVQKVGIAPAVVETHGGHGPGHEAYLLGTWWLGRRTPDGLRRAIAAFGEAIAADSAYAPAFAGLSAAYALALTYRYAIGLDGFSAAGMSLAAANRAIVLDSALAAAWAARGYIGALSGAPPELGVSDFERARALQPNAPNIPSWSARVLAQTGEIESAFREAQRAVALDPLASGRRIAVAYLALHLGRYELAVTEARRARELEPELMLARAIEGRALLLNHRAGECTGLQLGPHEIVRAMCLHDLGHVREGRAIVDSVEAELSSGAHSDSVFTTVLRAEDVASYYAWVGEPDRALTWVRYAYAASPIGIDVRILESGLFTKARESPVFSREVRRIRSSLWSRVVAESLTALKGVERST